MPIYEYQCNACEAKHEFIQKFSEGPKRKCPSCGRNRLRKLISAAAFHLKGEGWYVTDFRDKDKDKKKKKGEEDKTKAATAEDTSKTKSDTTSDAKTSDNSAGKKDGAASKGGDGKKAAAK